MENRHNHKRQSQKSRISLILCCLIVFAAGLSWSGHSAETATAGLESGRIRAASADGIWQSAARTGAPAAARAAATKRRPLVQLNREALTRLLQSAPIEFSEQARRAPAVMTLPMPDGSFAKFGVVESPIMEPGLAAAFPHIKTYLARGIDDPTALARFDWMPSGLHAMILSARGTVYIDPASADDPINYTTLDKRDRAQGGGALACLSAGESEAAAALARAESASVVRPMVVNGNGSNLRTFRLAMAATSEYTVAAGGGQDQAIQRLTTTVNRVNGIFERDLAIRLVLVNNNASIVYVPAAPEPYTNGDAHALLGQNQQNLDSVIGKANYDVGHVLSTGSGGAATIGVVCQDGSKAQGASVARMPVGDVFDVDEVAHQIGHQFGMHHTFNGSSGACGLNRTAASAFEPGSGSTIEGYASLCGAENLQAAADDYFHIKNIEEALAYIAGSGNCATTAPTGNMPPTVSAGPNFTIPKGTPFTLTASATDPDPGDNDSLTYAWEEYDLGPAGPPNDDSDGQARPLFRSFPPSANPARTFPRMDLLLNPQSTFACDSGTCITGETLPSIARAMNFQVTVRDNHAGGGGVASAQTAITVTGAGPFAVTAPAAGAVAPSGGPLTVTWNVAGTASAPVNAANVKITLSTDGGATFATSLADSVPNNGSAPVTLPSATAAAALIKVEALGNIFFNISPPFSIQPACAAIVIGPDSLPAAGQFVQYNQAINVTGGTGDIALSVTAGALPGGVQVAGGALTGAPQDAGAFSFSVTAVDAAGCTATKAYILQVLPGLVVGDAGAGGATPQATKTLTFPVSLTAPSSQTVTVQFATQDGSAVAGQNYVQLSGTLTFAPGTTTQNIAVSALGTTGNDAVDQFTVELSNPVNAMIADGEGLGDIVQNPAANCPGIIIKPGPTERAAVGVSYLQQFFSSNAAGLVEVAVDGGALPPGLTLDHAAGVLSGIPTVAGTFKFSIAGFDPNFCQGSVSVTVTIFGAPPVIFGFAPESGPPGTQVLITGSRFVGVTAVRFGSALATFTVISPVQIMATAPSGAVSGPISVTAGGGGAVSADSFTFLSSAPVAQNVSLQTTLNLPITGRLAATNPAGLPLTFELVDLREVGNGVVTLSNPGTGDFVYSPKPNFMGSDVFLFRVTDGVRQSNIAVATITVTGPDFTISFPSSSVAAQRGTKVRLEVDINRTTGFTGNVTVTPPQISVAGLKLPADAVTTTDASVTFKVKVRGSAAVGPIQLTFTARDALGRTRTATVTLVIQ